MARFNEILAGRYNRFLQKLFQLKGGPPAAQLASEVMPVFPFFAGVENRFLETWDRFMAGTSVAPSAGNLSGARLRNPATSNSLAVVEKMVVLQGTTSQMSVGQQAVATDLASVMPSTRLDARGRQNTGLVVSFQNTTAAIPTGNGLVLNPPANTEYDVITFEDQEMTLLPGDAITVTTVANVLLVIGLMWRERALEESELK